MNKKVIASQEKWIFEDIVNDTGKAYVFLYEFRPCEKGNTSKVYQKIDAEIRGKLVENENEDKKKGSVIDELRRLLVQGQNFQFLDRMMLICLRHLQKDGQESPDPYMAESIERMIIEAIDEENAIKHLCASMVSVSYGNKVCIDGKIVKRHAIYFGIKSSQCLGLFRNPMYAKLHVKIAIPMIETAMKLGDLASAVRNAIQLLSFDDNGALLKLSNRLDKGERDKILSVFATLHTHIKDREDRGWDEDRDRYFIELRDYLGGLDKESLDGSFNMICFFLQFACFEDGEESNSRALVEPRKKMRANTVSELFRALAGKKQKNRHRANIWDPKWLDLMKGATDIAATHINMVRDWVPAICDIAEKRKLNDCFPVFARFYATMFRHCKNDTTLAKLKEKWPLISEAAEQATPGLRAKFATDCRDNIAPKLGKNSAVSVLIWAFALRDPSQDNVTLSKWFRTIGNALSQTTSADMEILTNVAATLCNPMFRHDDHVACLQAMLGVLVRSNNILFSEKGMSPADKQEAHKRLSVTLSFFESLNSYFYGNLVDTPNEENGDLSKKYASQAGWFIQSHAFMLLRQSTQYRQDSKEAGEIARKVRDALITLPTEENMTRNLYFAGYIQLSELLLNHPWAESFFIGEGKPYHDRSQAYLTAYEALKFVYHQIHSSQQDTWAAGRPLDLDGGKENKGPEGFCIAYFNVLVKRRDQFIALEESPCQSEVFNYVSGVIKGEINVNDSTGPLREWKLLVTCHYLMSWLKGQDTIILCDQSKLTPMIKDLRSYNCFATFSPDLIKDKQASTPSEFKKPIRRGLSRIK